MSGIDGHAYRVHHIESVYIGSGTMLPYDVDMDFTGIVSLPDTYDVVIDIQALKRQNVTQTDGESAAIQLTSPSWDITPMAATIIDDSTISTRDDTLLLGEPTPKEGGQPHYIYVIATDETDLTPTLCIDADLTLEDDKLWDVVARIFIVSHRESIGVCIGNSPDTGPFV